VRGAKKATAKKEIVTIDLIAEKAGVSKASVSRVLNGSATVSPELKKKVTAVVRRYGYVPNASARRLAGGRSGLVVLLLEETNEEFFLNPFWGQIVQGFPSKKWAYHLGLRESTFNNFNLPYKSLDKISIGIEICGWGQLTYRSGKFYTWTDKVLSEEDVIELSTPFRGFKYFHNYTDSQIDSVEKLLRYWGETYNIPLTYNPDIFDVNARALSGERGVFTHCSVRYDKIDIYPHPKLIEMLKSL